MVWVCTFSLLYLVNDFSFLVESYTNDRKFMLCVTTTEQYTLQYTIYGETTRGNT